MAEASRVISQGGALLLISYEPPAGRLPFIDDPALGWESVKVEEDDNGNYIYTCRKRLLPAEAEEPPDLLYDLD